MKQHDSHCHLGLLRSEQWQDYVAVSATQIALSMSIGDDWVCNVRRCQSLPNHYAGVGFHPWYVAQHGLPMDWQQQLQTQLANDVVVCMGEIGLDGQAAYESTWAEQVMAFDAQLLFAKQHRLKVVCHHTKATACVVDRIRRQAPDIAVMFHGTNVHQQVFDGCQFDYWFGVGKHHRQLLQSMTWDELRPRLLLESDWDGRKFEQAHQAKALLQDTTQRIARFYGVTVSAVQAASWQNFHTFLSVKD